MYALRDSTLLDVDLSSDPYSVNPPSHQTGTIAEPRWLFAGGLTTAEIYLSPPTQFPIARVLGGLISSSSSSCHPF